MKREFRDLWVKDLEENQHLFTTGKLKRDNNYCALGRACVVAGIPITDSGMNCLNFDGSIIEGDHDGYYPLECVVGIDVNAIIDYNDHCDNFNDVISYLKNVEVTD